MLFQGIPLYQGLHLYLEGCTCPKYTNVHTLQ